MRACAAFLLAAGLAATAAADSPDAGSILKRVRMAYADLTSYQMQLEMESSERGPDSEQSTRNHVLAAWQRGGQFRVESKGTGGRAIVSNGRDLWNYNQAQMQYTKAASDMTMHDAFAVVAGGAPLFPYSPGFNLLSTKLAAEETLTVAGAAHPCYVIEIRYGAKSPTLGGPERTAKFWIDQSSYLILKRTLAQHIEPSESSQPATDTMVTLTLISQEIGRPLAQDLFTFDPPVGAQLILRADQKATAARTPLQKPGVALIGQPGAEFELHDLDGHNWQLSSLRGHLVLLDFWATWCGPCRAEIPVIEKIHRKEKDVTVLGIDVGEDEDVVRKFIAKEKVSYPILLAGQAKMTHDYDVRAYPSVVILDRNMVIQTYKTGYGSNVETDLRDALQTARRAHRISKPHVISAVEPDFSEDARRAQVSGVVELSLTVSADGKPSDIKVVRPLGHGLDEKAVEAVSTWKFQPALKDGEPFASPAAVEVNFKFKTLRERGTTVEVPEPNNAEEAYRSGVRFAQAGQLDDAVAMFAKAIKWRPEWAIAIHAQGHAYYRQKKYDEAIHDYDEALRLDSSRGIWYADRGLAYSYSGRHTRAIEDYNRAIEINPNTAGPAYNSRGWAYLELGQLDKAVPDLTKAIEIAPDYLLAYENRAKAYAALKDWPHAISDYSAAIELRPSRWQYEQRAAARRASGDAHGADEDLRKAQELPSASRSESR